LSTLSYPLPGKEEKKALRSLVKANMDFSVKVFFLFYHLSFDFALWSLL